MVFSRMQDCITDTHNKAARVRRLRTRPLASLSCYGDPVISSAASGAKAHHGAREAKKVQRHRSAGAGNMLRGEATRGLDGLQFRGWVVNDCHPPTAGKSDPFPRVRRHSLAGPRSYRTQPRRLLRLSVPRVVEHETVGMHADDFAEPLCMSVEIRVAQQCADVAGVFGFLGVEPCKAVVGMRKGCSQKS